MTDQPEFIGRFPVVDTLGIGGMGVVYLAKDPDIGRSVAIKVLHANRFQSDLGRFKNEARTIGELSHPNIVVLLEYGIDGGYPFLVMEYLEGESLEKWIGTPHSLSEHKTILVDLCNALEFAHSKDILHRDLKPGNVQVLPSGQAKLLDFGIARSHDSELTVTGVVMGTPKYLAPETLETGTHTKTSDCYSLGLLAYTMLSGHNPFSAPTYDAAIMKQFTFQPPFLHELNATIPVKLSKTIAAYLNKNPGERPDNPALLRDTLALLASPKLLKKRVDTIEPPREPSALATTIRLKLQSSNKLPSSAKKPNSLIWGAGMGLLLAGLTAWGIWRFAAEQPVAKNPAPTLTATPAQPTSANPSVVKSVSPPAIRPKQDVGAVTAHDKPEHLTELTTIDPANKATANKEETPVSTLTDTGLEKPASTITKKPAIEKTENIAAVADKQPQPKITDKKPVPDPKKTAPQKTSSPKTAGNHPDKKSVDKVVQKEKPKKKETKPRSTTAAMPHKRETVSPPPKKPVVTLPSFSSLSSSNTLTAINSPHLLRGKTTKLLIKAPDISKITEFQVYFGRKKTPKLEIRRVKIVKGGLVEISIYADPNAILGSYSLYGFYNKVNKTRPLFLEVSL